MFLLYIDCISLVLVQELARALNIGITSIPNKPDFYYFKAV